MPSSGCQRQCTTVGSALSGLIALLVWVAISLPAGDLLAQTNSLRPARRSTQVQNHQPDYSYADSSPVTTQPHQDIRKPRPDEWTTPADHARTHIALTDYQSAEGPDHGVQRSENIGKKSLVASADQLPWQDPNRILDLIMKVSLNLVFVLCFAFGAILLARRWMQPSTSSRNTARLGADSLSVLQTLRLDQKTSVRLVQWRSNRFLIACDQNGIQSVNALNDSFDQTLTEMEAEDQLVTRLLASLENNKP